MNANNKSHEMVYSSALEISYRADLVDWKRPPESASVSSEDLLVIFFEKILSLSILDFIVIPHSVSLIDFGNEKLPKICVSEPFLKKHIGYFVKSAMKGGMVVSVNGCHETMINVYQETGWAASNIADTELKDYLTSNVDENILRLIFRLAKSPIFLFNHDADPVYFFNAKNVSRPNVQKTNRID